MKGNPNELFKELTLGNRQALAKSITLVESTKSESIDVAEELLDRCLSHSGNSIRIGITGVPGVGKSTFIESFGKYLIQKKGKKVAVLAIDPSSTKSKGSILGDKTRMLELSALDNAFIRPSPTSGTLGGVGMATREVILLCEAAGFDIIIVETVGVGQSETEVKDMVDFFLLLMLPGAGDELQGIKRGIIELADALFINKAEGDNLKLAKQAKSAYQSALHLYPPTRSGWKPPVELCSALSGFNIDAVWDTVVEFEKMSKKSGFRDIQRQLQMKNWFKNASEIGMLSQYHHAKNFEKLYVDYEKKVSGGKVSPRTAARQFVGQLLPDRSK